MIRLTNFAEIEAIDELDDMVESVDIANKIILDEVHEELEPQVLADFQQIAPKHNYAIGEFPWTTPKQQRAFFASNGFGAGIPTQRTNRIVKMWVFEIRGSALVFENPHPASKFLGGSLAQNRSQATRYQQRFHADRWPVYHDLAIKWSDIAMELYLEKFDARLSKFAKSKVGRRAFTR